MFKWNCLCICCSEIQSLEYLKTICTWVWQLCTPFHIVHSAFLVLTLNWKHCVQRIRSTKDLRLLLCILWISLSVLCPPTSFRFSRFPQGFEIIYYASVWSISLITSWWWYGHCVISLMGFLAGGYCFCFSIQTSYSRMNSNRQFW